jgi:WD40 repeat protein
MADCGQFSKARIATATPVAKISSFSHKDQVITFRTKIKSTGYGKAPWTPKTLEPKKHIINQPELVDYDWEVFPQNVLATDVVFPDSKRPELTLSCGSDFSIILSNSSKNRSKGLTGHRARILSLQTSGAASANGQRLALSCSDDRTLRLWGLQTGDCLASMAIDCQDGCFAGLDGAIVIATKRNLQIFSYQFNEAVNDIDKHQPRTSLKSWGTMTDERVSHSIDLIASDPLALHGSLIGLSSNKKALLWDLHKAKVVACADDIFKNDALALRLSDSSTFSFAVASSDNCVRLWDSRTMSCVAVLSEELALSRGNCRRIACRGSWVLVPSECGNLVSFDIRNSKAISSKVSNAPLFAVDASAAGVCVTHNNSISFQTSR